MRYPAVGRAEVFSVVGKPLPTSSEDGIPEILAKQRPGHEVPGMRGLYTHVTRAMREDLTAALQARRETSLRDRAALAQRGDPHAPVPLLNNLLAPYRTARQDTGGPPRPRLALARPAGTGKPGRTSQIPPSTATVPIRSMGWGLSGEPLTWP